MFIGLSVEWTNHCKVSTLEERRKHHSVGPKNVFSKVRFAHANAATRSCCWIMIVEPADGMYIADCPAIPGCVSQGQTEAEAEANISDAIRECLAVRAELGMPLTVTTREVEVAV
jgi:predicted RNase H-like HicB family nuclease